MICRRCQQEVPDRIFGYCEPCATALGAKPPISIEDRIRQLRQKRVESRRKRKDRNEYAKRSVSKK